MAKTKVIAPKKLMGAELKATIREIVKISAQIDELKKSKKEKDELVMAALGHRGKLKFEELNATVVQALRRSVPWKDICMGLIKKFMTGPELRNFLRGIVRKYPKKESAAYLLVTKVKAEKQSGKPFLVKGRKASL